MKKKAPLFLGACPVTNLKKAFQTKTKGLHFVIVSGRKAKANLKSLCMFIKIQKQMSFIILIGGELTKETVLT